MRSTVRSSGTTEGSFLASEWLLRLLGDGASEDKITRGSAGCWALAVGSLNGDVDHVEVGILGSGRVQCGQTHWAANRYSIYYIHTV